MPKNLLNVKHRQQLEVIKTVFKHVLLRNPLIPANPLQSRIQFVVIKTVFKLVLLH